MKKIIVAAIILVIISILTFFVVLFFKKKTDIIETFGNIEIRQVDLSFQVSGVLNRLYKEEGDYIKKGELIATIDDRDYRANYKKAIYLEKSSLAQAKDDISKFERNYPLCFDNTISKEECTSLLNKKEYSKAKYKENIENRIYQKNQLDYTKLYAPQDGIITTRAQEKVHL